MHTPGPWRFSKSESSEWGLIVDSHENIIANVNSETDPDIPPLVSMKVPCTANGMLMAAAPDMHAALLAVERAAQLSNTCEDGAEACLEWMAAADAAVDRTTKVLQRLRDAGVIA